VLTKNMARRFGDNVKVSGFQESRRENADRQHI
jgi:hypothetical protein